MPELNPAFGILLLLLGAGFFALTLGLLYFLPRFRPITKASPSPLHALQLPAHNEAVLLVQSGGRVAYLNQQARELFNVWEEDPNLESLARRARPSETFLVLCATEGQARFSLNGRFVEATSYLTTFANGNWNDQSNLVLVTLRRPQIVLESESRQANGEGASARQDHPEPELTNQTFSIFAELSQAMASSLELETALQAILESIERLIPSDFLELTVWEPESQSLTPYRLVGLSGVDRHIEKGSERYQAGQGYSGFLIANSKPLLIKDVNAYRALRPALDRQRYPFLSYLGLPLLIASEVIGTLELASLAKESYTENDLEVLKLLSGPAAVALNNALLYRKEHMRSEEMLGLARLAQSVSVLRDPQDLYLHLVESISPLIHVDIMGFLVYDENRRMLQGQPPFLGIQSNVIEWYQVAIEPGSPAEAIWQSGESIIATDAPQDPRLQSLELNHLALAAGIRQTVLVPLATGGRTLGYLQVANKHDGTAFDQNDLRILAIIGGQTAPIIDNATLIQQSRRRAQRAETLRRIASLTSSTATLDEILKFSLLDLARLLQADMAAIFMLDESRGELKAHRGSMFGVTPEIGNKITRLSIDDPQFPLTVTGSRQQFFTGDLAEAQSIISLYEALVDELKVRSAINVPLVVRQRGIGELMVGSFKPHFFSSGDIQTVATGAGLLAAAIEQSTLYSLTDQNLRQRVEQLTALTRVSRELNSTIDHEHLLQRVYDELLRVTGADCGTILLFELNTADDGQAVLLSGSYQAEETRLPKTTLHLGDLPGVNLHPLEESVLLSGEPILVEDFSLQMSLPTHSGVRSALIIPIAYQGQVAGLIHLHSKMPGHFKETELEIAESLAVQAAIALGNAQRYQEQRRRSEMLNRRVETLSKLFEVSQVLQSDQPLEQSLETIAYAIQGATPFDIVLISVYNPETNQLARLANAGIPIPKMVELKARPQPWSGIQKLLTPQFRLGRSYFIPEAFSSSTLPEEVEMYTPLPQDHRPSEEQSWHPHDVLIVPLFGSSGEPLGLVSVDAPRNNVRPDRATIETLEIFSSQAGLIIESQQKIKYLKTRLDKIQEDLELAETAAESAQKHLPALLHKDLEQTLAVQNLSQRSRRLNAGLDIVEIVNRQSSRADVWKTLSFEMLGRMDFDTVLLAEPTPGGLNLLQSLGAIPSGVNPKTLLGQRNPLRHCLSSGETLLVSDLESSAEWQGAPLLRSLETRSFICLPIHEIPSQGNGSQPAGAQAALLAISKTPVAPFISEDQQLFDLLVRQVAIALQNLKLLDDTTRRLREVNLLLDFSQQLGSLDPDRILHSLVDSALHVVPMAQSAMVVVWNAGQGVLEPRLGWGYANTQSLMGVLYQPGEGLAGQVFEQRRAIRLDEIEFTRHYNLSAENLMRYRDATGGRLPVSSLAVPIITGTSSDEKSGSAKLEGARATPLGVLVLDNSLVTSAFTDDDLALITSLAQQTALTLENARLYQGSEQRSLQLQALTSATANLSAQLEPDALILDLLDQLKNILTYDTGTLWIREKREGARPGQSGSDRMLVRAARGFADSDQRIGLTVDVKDSQLLEEMTRTSQPIWVPDIRKDARFRTFSIEEQMPSLLQEASLGFENLSWLGVPLILGGRVIGVIALEKLEPDFYTPDDIQVMMTFAGQAAAGLENAQLYQESVQRAAELDKRSQILTILNRLSSDLSGSLDATLILNFAAQKLAQIIPCSSVSAITVGYEEKQFSSDNLGDLFLTAVYPRSLGAEGNFYPVGTPLPYLEMFERLRETQGIFSTEDVLLESDLRLLDDFLAYHQSRALLIVPIISGSTSDGSENAPELRFHGVLMAHNSQVYRYSADELDLARTISNQLAISLQNARLFTETRSLTQDLERRVLLRTAELEREHQRSETLLRIITELSASLDLDQVLNSTLRVLKEYVDAEQLTILIARPGDTHLQRLASVGYTTEPKAEGSPTPLGIDKGLAGWIISNRKSVLVEDVLEDTRWVQLPVESSDPVVRYHRSALGVPLMSGAEALGCLLLFHPDVDHFSEDQLDMVQAAANQVAVAVNNAELYRLIRDQAEDLGTMLRNQQVETSRSKAILEAVADGVLVTDTNRHISLFNASAERILGLERSRVLGFSMEQFLGLFGRAAQRWLDTINHWSQDPNAYQAGEIFAEMITLEDGRVISVQLAPVILRTDFLGTVSIFQDITHQVEVDRLKSEFVATVSHELRTPMTSIKGYVEILLMGAAGALSEQQAHFLQVVKMNTERLAVLVNDLLDISQIEAGRVMLSMQALNLEEIADQAISELKRRSGDDQKPVTIEKEIQPGLPRVYGDIERLRHIFNNLLDNAYLYNSPEGRITVRMQKLETEVQVEIQDTGVGIPPGDHQRVFERFYRGENPLVLGVSGTGLGLSIVRNLVQMHNGRIWFESAGIPGQGSTFTFTIPIYSSEERDLERETQTEN
jgi:PAS domain S-box-containing protein